MKNDLARPAVPLIHAAGLLALFTGPFFTRDDEGTTITATFADYRERMALFGDEWFIYVAMAGVAVAVAAAIFIPSRLRWLRIPLMALGSLTGLALPTLLYLEYTNGVPLASYIAVWGWGLWIYAGGCVSALAVTVYHGLAPEG